MTSEEYISQVLDHMPRATPRRSQIALELRGHIAERVERGQTVDDVVRQLGDPAALADSYLSAVPLVPASFVRRGAAKIVDLAMFVVCLAPLAYVAWRLLGFFAPVVVLLLGAFAFPIYFVAAEYVTGQTIGKRLLDVRVVRESGARIGLGQSFVRQLPQFLEVFWIDILFALFTDQNQRAFELLSHTRVVMAQSEEAGK
jgi:uncharacterized RDD family membrane protein YckC